jgi:nucleoid-associated protein YgaU
MMRGIAIFSFFALSTIFVIFMQPGPRPAFIYKQAGDAVNATSRNEVGVLLEPRIETALKVPDSVISKLKAAAQPVRAVAPVQPTSGGTIGSLQRLQAVLTASLEPETVATNPVLQARPQNVLPAQAAASELRDMSWQTLNALNGLGRAPKGPGQEGSLLNSIVRRSMGQVGSASTALLVQPYVAKALSVASVGQVQAAADQGYVVAPGDTLALIAVKLYGSALATDRLLSQNPVLRQNPNALRIGQVLQYSLR